MCIIAGEKMNQTMDQESKPPLLLEFLFGETAGTAQRGASARLKIWATAFKAWIAGHETIRSPKTIIKWKLAWRRLLQERGQMPWQLGERQ